MCRCSCCQSAGCRPKCNGVHPQVVTPRPHCCCHNNYVKSAMTQTDQQPSTDAGAQTAPALTSCLLLDCGHAFSRDIIAEVCHKAALCCLHLCGLHVTDRSLLFDVC